MRKCVLLDTNTLGMATNPGGTEANKRCKNWIDVLVAGGVLVRVPEIADYELRRALILAKKPNGIARLDALIDQIGYVPLCTNAMRKAAEFWAEARSRGRAGTDNIRLDGDMILCGQAAILAEDKHDIEIATDNTRHFSHFFKARMWHRIRA